MRRGSRDLRSRGGRLLRLMPNEVPRLLSLVWDGLLEFDELTSWTNSFMSLLSTIVIKSSSEMASLGQKPLSQLLPRLWPFLDHSSERIRSTVLQTVQTLIDSTSNFDGDRCRDDVLSDLMKRLYQRVILEDKSSVHENLFAVTNPEHVFFFSCREFRNKIADAQL